MLKPKTRNNFYLLQLEKEITAAMSEVSEGREVRVDVGDDRSWSVGVRKANGWWKTSMVPRYTTEITDPEIKMLVFMNLVPNNPTAIAHVDRIAFAVRFTKEHCRD
jgi:hypothetical protein